MVHRFSCRTLHRSLLLTVLPGALLALTCCQDPGSSEPVIVPPPPSTAPYPQRLGPAVPTPIQFEKPRMLGPMTPAIVLVPDKYREPLIRVRLGEEQDSPPPLHKSAYRGRVEAVRLANGNYIELNTLPLESYLKGVLAKELWIGRAHV